MLRLRAACSIASYHSWPGQQRKKKLRKGAAKSVSMVNATDLQALGLGHLLRLGVAVENVVIAGAAA